jgi:endo-1,4-beta-mannosidase
MWTRYSHSRTDADFAAIASLGANTVRVIVQPKAVGWPVVTATGASAVKDVIDTAARHGLGVELTLFDLWYSWSDINGSTAWAAQLLRPYRGDARIARVELRNEIPTTHPALTWARAMLPYLATLLPGVPRSLSTIRTASLRAIANAAPAGALDVIDVHLYGDIGAMPARLAAARAVAQGRPVIVGEAGAPTVGGTIGSDQSQLTFYQAVAQLVADAGLSVFAPWILSDSTSTGIPKPLQNPITSAMGLRRLDGSWKPAAGVVRAMFGGARNLSFTAN